MKFSATALVLFAVSVGLLFVRPDAPTPGIQYECAAGTMVYIDGPDIEVTDAMVDAACDMESMVQEVNAERAPLVCYDYLGAVTTGENWKECRPSYG